MTYELKSLALIAIPEVVSGFGNYTVIVLFVEQKVDWIVKYVPLPEGKTPSHDIC